MSEHFRGRQGWSGLVLVAWRCVGLATSLGITRVPAADPAKRVSAPTSSATSGRRCEAMRGDRPLVLAVSGNTYFNFLGALLLLNLFFYGADVLQVE